MKRVRHNLMALRHLVVLCKNDPQLFAMLLFSFLREEKFKVLMQKYLSNTIIPTQSHRLRTYNSRVPCSGRIMLLLHDLYICQSLSQTAYFTSIIEYINLWQRFIISRRTREFLSLESVCSLSVYWSEMTKLRSLHNFESTYSRSLSFSTVIL